MPKRRRKARLKCGREVVFATRRGASEIEKANVARAEIDGAAMKNVVKDAARY
jgi:hypothetical protein